jgi:hypothetical protein
MKVIIVSGADAAYWALLSRLLRSIEAEVQIQKIAVGILDFGLMQGQRDRLQEYGAKIVLPAWDYPIEHLKQWNTLRDWSQTTRPFLPRYFPGFDLYVWLDADCWVQEWQAIALLTGAALQRKFAIVPEVHHSYGSFLNAGPSFIEWAHSTYRRCYDDAAAKRLSQFPILNCGVFGATPDALHWSRWQFHLSEIIKRLDQSFFFAEQTALNYVIRYEKLTTAFLPAYCNFICSRARPYFNLDHGVFVEPDPPFARLGVVHFAAAKDSSCVAFDKTGKRETRPLINVPLLERS